MVRVVACLLIICLCLYTHAFGNAETLGAQATPWQLDRAFEPGYLDSRLDQLLTIDIVGEALGPTLQRLSTETGVPLSVASDNLATLGERKVTLLARNLALRTIMVQLPETLPACAWDIIGQGDTASYRLRWTSLAYYTTSFQHYLHHTPSSTKRSVQVRGTRIDEAFAAWSASAAQQQAVEQHDSLLALAVRHPTTRLALEALVNLAPADLETFLQSGRLHIPWASAPEPLRQAAQAIIDDFVAMTNAEAEHLTAEEVAQQLADIQALREQLPNAVLGLKDAGCERGLGIILDIDGNGKTVIPPRHTLSDQQYQQLLQQLTPAEAPPFANAGMDTSASATASDEAVATSPPPPASTRAELQQLVTFAGSSTLTMTDFQKEVARQTKYSIIADYFTTPPLPLPEALQQELPLWQALDVVAKETQCEWKNLSACLVLHH